ncbi:pyrimidine dimer DNA glycosylase/endonuclease V [Kurthia massiliensis]|uniref:pyrimidine dimer DNA glycosylase/endonuclease V n=1 Tax=Kurthia massiliensis TaxID=1033739 RepID=UPI00028A36CE|nr:pyrimidine dimer DNA glycosylase/endonuclease V [Kurthia massiliensis]
MRLWHTDIIPFLPKGQLLSQWRELNSIFAKEDKHVLINYIYDYPKADLRAYTDLIIQEMKARGYNIRSYEKMERYFADVEPTVVAHPFARDHDDTYLEICYFNLKEKFIRGQKDYEAAQFEALDQYVKQQLNR